MNTEDLMWITAICIILGGVFAQCGLMMVAIALGIVAVITLSSAFLKYLNRT